MLTTSPLQQAASSQGATSSTPPVASTSGACATSLPLGGFLEEVDMAPTPALPLDEDVVMESAMTRELRPACPSLGVVLSRPLMMPRPK